MTSVPATMQSWVAPKYGSPSTWELMEMPTPKIQNPNEVLLKVRAATIQTGDTQVMAGAFRLFAPLDFPAKVGQEGSGVVVAVGSKVKNFKAGDEVLGIYFPRPVLPLRPLGFCSEYVVIPESALIHKPPQVSFSEAATVLGSGMTAVQTIRRGMELLSQPDGTLEGKTVFVPGALSGTGSIGIQVLKNVYKARKVIATVSTSKMGQVERYLPGMVDQLIDYKKQNVVKEVGKGTVDFVYNTQWDLTSMFAIANPKTGTVMSIASAPKADLLRQVLGPNNVPFWAAWLLHIVNAYYSFLLRGTNIKYEFVSGNTDIREDIELVGEMLARRQIRGVFTEVSFDDVDKVRTESQKVATGKGGIGKIVFTFP
ncbi:GroES-like protein [Thozetella sp. PMI_491]|nr:GroES-like protein [Thozetella sp. PMI_491]